MALAASGEYAIERGSSIALYLMNDVRELLA